MEIYFAKSWRYSPQIGVTNVYHEGWVYNLSPAVADLAIAADVARKVDQPAHEPTPEPEPTPAPEPAPEAPTEPEGE